LRKDNIPTSIGGATLFKNIIVDHMIRAYMTDECKGTLIEHKEGQSMVEFALILPALVLIIAGIFDLGRAFFAYISITNAAREGARYGALNPDYLTGACEATKGEALNSGITILDSDITISCGTVRSCPIATNQACSRHQPIIVNVGYNYNDMIFKFFFKNPIYMNHQVEMLIP
jgi:TadE-like protein